LYGERSELPKRLELRDLRSLERRSMYSIFHPLDVNERLPRELLLEGRRYRWFDVKHLDLIGFLYLPAVIVTVVVISPFNMAVAYAVAGLSFAGVFAYVLWGRRS
jgi:hypothetical protein